MPRIILTSRYLKPANAKHKTRLIRYIAERKGAEPVLQTNGLLDATKKQKQLIAQILNDFPDAKDAHEYADYLARSNQKNASDFIAQALENNADRIAGRKNYVGYLANRPRVEKIGAHGLFTDDRVPVVLDKVMGEVAAHPGNVWTTVVSLRREDAQRLGYDNADAWMELIRSKRNLMAEQMKIHPDNLKWYAAFHNESHHPHVHIMMYSAKPKEGFLTETGIEKMRSMFAREIFKHDLIQIYQKQTERRGVVTEQAKKTMEELIAQIKSGVCVNRQLETDLLLLARRLRNTRGKKVYGYLKADVKAVIDRIIDELANMESVAVAYDAWQEMRNEVLLIYSDKLPDPLPLSEQKDFAKIRQVVIDEAMRVADSETISAPDITSVSDSGGTILQATRLLNHLSRIFEDSTQNMITPRHTDSKARRKEQYKKMAQGHAHDDHTPEQTQ